MRTDDEIIESLVKAGIIGAALGALITNDKSNTVLGALAGAAIAASLQASEDAQKTNLPMVVEENGSTYKILPGGQKKHIRSLNKTIKPLQKKFSLT